MADLHTAAQQPPFRALRLANQSWSLLFKDPAHLARLAGGWFLLMELGLFLIQMVSDVTPDAGALMVFLLLLKTIIGIFVIDVISVAWIRFTAFGEREEGTLAPIDDLVIRYAIYTFITGLGIGFISLVLVYSPSVVIGGMPGMGVAAVILSLWVIIGLVIVIYVGTRVSLFWIDVVGAEAPFQFVPTLTDAWDSAHGNVMRLFTGSLITALPFVLLAYAIGVIGKALPGQTIPQLFLIVSDAFGVAAVFAILGFLALADAALQQHEISHT